MDHKNGMREMGVYELRGYLEKFLFGKTPSTSTLRNWANTGKIPGRKYKGRWYFDAVEITVWLNGGIHEYKYHFAFLPARAVDQVKGLLNEICSPSSQVDNEFQEIAQRRLGLLVFFINTERRYKTIRARVRGICAEFKGNPALSCLSIVPNFGW